MRARCGCEGHPHPGRAAQNRIRADGRGNAQSTVASQVEPPGGYEGYPATSESILKYTFWTPPVYVLDPTCCDEHLYLICTCPPRWHHQLLLYGRPC
eukprot:1260813-Prymnesium_polylepis.1